MRDKSDHYTLRAKKEGYPARSVYKLEEIQRKYNLITPGMNVLDLGAAPGSWSLFVLKKLGGRGSVTAVDLCPAKTLAGRGKVFPIRGDFTDPEIRKRIAERGPYDCILSDAAPATTGNRTVDTGRSYTLAAVILDIVAGMLRPGGSSAIKIFQGGDERELLERMRKMFDSARQIKPKASRKESFEVFLIGTGFTGG
ncbi:MAG: RlmE family RNA methyltransferase [bacterium]